MKDREAPADNVADGDSDTVLVGAGGEPVRVGELVVKEPLTDCVRVWVGVAGEAVGVPVAVGEAEVGVGVHVDTVLEQVGVDAGL